MVRKPGLLNRCAQSCCPTDAMRFLTHQGYLIMAGFFMTATAWASNPLLFWKKTDLIQLEASGRLSKICPKGSTQTLDQLQLKDYRTVVPWMGAWYATRFQRIPQEKGPSKRTLELLESQDGKHWEVWASLPLEDGRGQPSYFLPLGNEKVLMVAGSSWLFDGKASGRFALGRRVSPGSQSRLVIERILPLELPKDVESRAVDLLGPLFFFPTLQAVEGGWALVHSTTGQIWTFWMEGGVFRQRRTALYPWMLEGYAKNQRFETPILYSAPQVDGSVLVAARSAAAVLETRPQTDQEGQKVPLTHAEKAMSKEALMQQMMDRAKAQAPELERQRLAHWRKNPELLWFEVDPKEGRVREVHPQGAPSLLPEKPPFRFTLDGKGRVRTASTSQLTAIHVK